VNVRTTPSSLGELTAERFSEAVRVMLPSELMTDPVSGNRRDDRRRGVVDADVHVTTVVVFPKLSATTARTS